MDKVKLHHDLKKCELLAHRMPALHEQRIANDNLATEKEKGCSWTT